MSIRVRIATHKDVPELMRLGLAFKQESHYSKHPVDTDILRRNIAELIKLGAKNMDVTLVAESGNGHLLGMLHGVMQPLLFSKQRIASEVYFYVTPSSRGSSAALKLLTAFRTWAINRDCIEIRMHTAANIFPERFKKLLLKMGFKSFGENFSRWL